MTPESRRRRCTSTWPDGGQEKLEDDSDQGHCVREGAGGDTLGGAGQAQSSSMGELELPPATEARESSEEELGPCTATKAKARSEEELEPRTATDTKGRRREELNPLIATKTGGAVERSCCRPPPLRPWGAGSKSWTSL